MQRGSRERRDSAVFDNPQWVDALFNNTSLAWLWLMVRVWLGVNWVQAGWHKTQEAAWVVGGMAVKGYWEHVIVIPERGRPPIAYDWYRQFLEFLLNAELHGVFGFAVAWGELLVGLALIAGVLTGFAAFFGAVMNWSFMLAGTASTNPVLGLVALALIVAWKTAGWWGLDRFLLPWIGVPWRRSVALGARLALLDDGADRGTAGQWILMILAAAIAVVALGYLDSVLQIVACVVATAIAAFSGIRSMLSKK